MKVSTVIHAVRGFIAGLLFYGVVGCSMFAYKDTVADKGIANDTKESVETIKSKTSASAGVIKKNASNPEVVANFAERIIQLNGPATLADEKEAETLIILPKAKWDSQLAKDAKLGDENRSLLGKLDGVMSDLQKLRAEAEQRRKDDAVRPFHIALFVALALLLYYAVVKKDPIQSALCGAIALFCGFAPGLYDGKQAELLKWILSGGLSVYSLVFFYDLIKTKLGLTNAVLVAESLKKTDASQTQAVLDTASSKMGAIAKAAIRDVKAEVGVAEQEGTRLFTWIKNKAVSIFGSLRKLFS